MNKKHLKNVGPIRHCEPPHAHSPGVASGTVARCLRIDVHDNANDDNDNDNDSGPLCHALSQRVTEWTAMAPWNGPNNAYLSLFCKTNIEYCIVLYCLSSACPCCVGGSVLW